MGGGFGDRLSPPSLAVAHWLYKQTSQNPSLPFEASCPCSPPSKEDLMLATVANQTGWRRSPGLRLEAQRSLLQHPLPERSAPRVPLKGLCWGERTTEDGGRKRLNQRGGKLGFAEHFLGKRHGLSDPRFPFLYGGDSHDLTSLFQGRGK